LAALSGGVSVTNNTVSANDEGIGIYSLPSPTNIPIMSNTVFNNAFLGIHIDANSGGNTVELNTIYGNSEYDEVDETGSWSSPNNWGTDPSNYNILGNGGPYAQFLGSLECAWQ
jgi:parallel beta-helix repeat protein